MPLKDVRYITGVSSFDVPHRLTDVLVIGSGAAGLRCAIGAATRAKVLVVTKKGVEESLTLLAQGGIASPISSDDSVEFHIKDTIETGCGLCDERTVRMIIKEGVHAVEELIKWGVNFDKSSDGSYALASEGGHSKPRVLRSSGDATGREIERVLSERARNHPNITILENTFAIDLLTQNNRCVGAILFSSKGGKEIVWARATVLATGGAGQIYRETTNSEIASGDGIAMAYRAGAKLRDLEFVQFHPTALYVAGAIRALISEAVRGEGAYLINRFGERFMLRYHPKAELAPRDVVSRAILSDMKRTHDTQVYLTLSHLNKETHENRVKKRFPGLWRLCAAFDIDLSRDPVPVRPAAHYFIGGIKTDIFGRTSIKGLFAAGETASTALHGANRLASNSLLESLVMGKRTAVSVLKYLRKCPHLAPKTISIPPPKWNERILVRDVEDSLRSLMWWQVGIERNATELEDALKRLSFWCRYVLRNNFDTPDGWRLQNMLTVAYLVTESALMRQESRGVHYRTDFPQGDDKKWRCHIEVSRRESRSRKEK
ncbi:MAG: L-aspartate oxidase [Planctomycetota bacterium]|nr:L-aspartate oxidase [Planctomycetota bacterium]